MRRAYALTTVLAVVMLAGCSGSPAATGASVASCYQFAARAIQHHVTVTAVPAACQGLSQVEVNVAVSRALHAAAAGVRGKDRQRQVIGRDSTYVAGLIRAIPAPRPSAAASPSPPPGQPPVAPPPARRSSRDALSLAALVLWLVTVGLGVSMMARWLTRTRRPGRGAALNFTHLGLALAGLLVWIGYLATGVTGLAWTGCGFLLAAASLGMTLVFLGPAAAGTAAAGAAAASAPQPGTDPPPSGRPPALVIAAHITAAVTTILLATLAAIGPG